MTSVPIFSSFTFVQVDLGDEWRNTNIDECLEHIGGTGADDSVGLKEFVVMLAVGRVCRPLKRVRV